MKYKKILKAFKFLGVGGLGYYGGSKFLDANKFAYNIGSKKSGLNSASSVDLQDQDISSALLEQTLSDVTKHKYIGHVIWGQKNLEQIKESRDGSLIKIKEEIENKIVENNQLYKQHPSDFIHGLLSAHVYENNISFSEGAIAQFREQKQNERYNEYLQGWKIHKVFWDENSGYYGTIYVNEEKKQVVLAHRGTKLALEDLLKQDSPLRTDIDGILCNKIVPQQEKTFEATKEAVDYVEASQNNLHLSFTGHSLGAWLAEASIYFCYRDLQHRFVKAVTFDSPGSFKTYEVFKSNVVNSSTELNLHNLNIVTYLSYPNIVNSCNGHVGKVYQIDPKYQKPSYIENVVSKFKSLPLIGKQIASNEYLLHGLLSVMGHELGLMLAEFDPISGKPVNCSEVKDWPSMSYTESASSELSAKIKNLPLSIAASELAVFGSMIRVIGSYMSGGIDQQQYWKFFERIDRLRSEQTSNHEEVIDFCLRYQSHYKTVAVSCKEEILNSRDEGSVDWYFKKFLNMTPRDLKKVPDLLLRKQLIEIRKFCSKEAKNGSIYLVCSKESVEYFKNWLNNILEATKYEKEWSSLSHILQNIREFKQEIGDQDFVKKKDFSESLKKLNILTKNVSGSSVYKELQKQSNNVSFDQVYNIVKTELSAEDLIKNLQKSEPTQNLVNILHIVNLTANHMIISSRDVEKARDLLKLGKKAVQDYLIETCKLKSGDSLDDCSSTKQLNILTNFSGLAEVYIKTQYLVGRTYIYSYDYRRSGKDYDEANKCFKQVIDLGKKLKSSLGYEMFEVVLSERQGLNYIKEHKINKTLKEDNHKSKLMLLKAIEGYQKLKELKDEYILEYKNNVDIKEMKKIIPADDPIHRVACNQKIVTYYGRLIAITEDKKELSEYFNNLLKVIFHPRTGLWSDIAGSYGNKINDKIVSNTLNILGNMMLNIYECKEEFAILSRMMNVITKDEEEILSSTKLDYLDDNLSFIYRFFDSAQDKSANGEIACADANDGLVAVIQEAQKQITDEEQLLRLREEVKKYEKESDQINENLKRSSKEKIVTDSGKRLYQPYEAYGKWFMTNDHLGYEDGMEYMGKIVCFDENVVI